MLWFPALLPSPIDTEEGRAVDRLHGVLLINVSHSPFPFLCSNTSRTCQEKPRKRGFAVVSLTTALIRGVHSGTVRENAQLMGAPLMTPSTTESATPIPASRMKRTECLMLRKLRGPCNVPSGIPCNAPAPRISLHRTKIIS